MTRKGWMDEADDKRKPKPKLSWVGKLSFTAPRAITKLQNEVDRKLCIYRHDLRE